jgi:hypothetical protein
LKEILGLSQEPPLNIRYQLFHRLASAIIEAEQFNAQYAIMIIHSFSTSRKGFVDYKNFVELFGATAENGKLVHLTDQAGIAIYTGWAEGNLDKG